MGAAAAAADAEVLALAATALTALALDDFRFSLGHLGYFHGLVHHLQLESEATLHLQNALERKSQRDVETLVEQWRLIGPERQTVLGLLTLSGQQGEGVLARARKQALNRQMLDAVERLAAVESLLERYGVKAFFDIDLADVRAMYYYTGITFKAYTPGIGFSIVNGGRYDRLVGEFGPDMPAVGCAFYIDRLLLAQIRQSGQPAEPEPDLLLFPCDCGEHIELARIARQAGLSVAVALGDENPDRYSLRAYCECDGQVTLDDGLGTRTIPIAQWLEAVTT
jgi:ATP phosphoribosyltransferase regulatory subunit